MSNGAIGLAGRRGGKRGQVEDATVTLRGRVEALYFSSPTFSAGRIRTHEGGSASFVGPVMLQMHEPVVLVGAWENHPKFGRQFRAERFTYDRDLDVDGLAHYLANHPDIKGIGPVKAREIAEAFGTRFEQVLIETPDRIAEVARVPRYVIQGLRVEWERTKAINSTLTWLASYGLTHHEVKTLVEKFGNNAVAVLQANPYLAIGVARGLGFRRIDNIARKTGIPKSHTGRIEAGILYVVDDRLDHGDCWVDYQELIELANVLLVLDSLDSRERIERAIEELIARGGLISPAIHGRLLVARPWVFQQEGDLARWFAEGLHPNPHFTREDIKKVMNRVGPKGLNVRQREALQAALLHNQVVVTGPAGSGKSFLAQTIVDTYERKGLAVLLAAPTGKAAKRLEQVVGRPAQTIHRLLEFNGKTFLRGPDRKLDAELVLLDEVSMCDVALLWRVYSAVDLARTCVVLLGDHNQLPPVGPGNPLRDLLERRVIPTVVLDQVVRQAGLLRENSMAILKGEVRPTSERGADGRTPWIVVDQFTSAEKIVAFLVELHERVIEERLGFDLLRDVQVLSPTRKGKLGTDALNEVLQRVVQKKRAGLEIPESTSPGKRFFVGDKVIQMRNNYDLDVMNGAIGAVTRLGAKQGDLSVEFDGRTVGYSADREDAKDLALAYACTAHKLQGSEFLCVISVIHKSSSFMNDRNLMYTAVTRAQKVSIVIGDPWGLKHCVGRERLEARKTFLSVLDFPRAKASAAVEASSKT